MRQLCEVWRSSGMHLGERWREDGFVVAFAEAGRAAARAQVGGWGNASS